MLDGWVSSRKFLFLLCMGLLYFHCNWIHWADSEIWPIYLSQHLFNNIIDDSLVYKFVFFLILKPIYSIPLNNIETFMAARFIFATIGIGVVYLVYKIAQTIYQDREKALLSAILLMTCTFFLSRGFRVRSDLLLSFFSLLMTYMFLLHKQSPQWHWRLAMGALVPVMIFTSPKVIFFLPVPMLFIFSWLWHEGSLKKYKKLLCLIFVLALVSGGLTILLFSKYMASAWSYFMNSFGSSSHAEGYLSAKSWFYIFRLLKENPFFVLLILVGLAIPFRFTKKSSGTKALWVSSLLGILFMVLHTDRLPFFIAALLPLPTIFVGGLLKDLFISYKVKAWVPSLVLTLLLLKASAFLVNAFPKNNNADQVESIERIERALNGFGRKPSIYDGLGVLPRYPHLQTFYIARDGIQSQEDLLNFLQWRKPEMIMFSNRMFFHFRLIMDFMTENHYVHVGGGIYFKGRFMNELPGEQQKTYSLYVGTQPRDMEFVKKGEAFQPKPLMLLVPMRPILLPGPFEFARIFDFDPNY